MLGSDQSSFVGEGITTSPTVPSAFVIDLVTGSVDMDSGNR